MPPMSDTSAETILVEAFPAARPSLRLAVVTETWPPEINGVSLTLSRLVQGLCARNHAVQLIRPRQTREDGARSDGGFEELLMRGMPIPRYPELKLGLPGKGARFQGLCGAVLAAAGHLLLRQAELLPQQAAHDQSQHRHHETKQQQPSARA